MQRPEDVRLTPEAHRDCEVFGFAETTVRHARINGQAQSRGYQRIGVEEFVVFVGDGIEMSCGPDAMTIYAVRPSSP